MLLERSSQILARRLTKPSLPNSKVNPVWIFDIIIVFVLIGFVVRCNVENVDCGFGIFVCRDKKAVGVKGNRT